MKSARSVGSSISSAEDMSNKKKKKIKKRSYNDSNSIPTTSTAVAGVVAPPAAAVAPAPAPAPPPQKQSSHRQNVDSVSDIELGKSKQPGSGSDNIEKVENKEYKTKAGSVQYMNQSNKTKGLLNQHISENKAQKSGDSDSDDVYHANKQRRKTSSIAPVATVAGIPISPTPDHNLQHTPKFDAGTFENILF